MNPLQWTAEDMQLVFDKQSTTGRGRLGQRFVGYSDFASNDKYCIAIPPFISYDGYMYGSHFGNFTRDSVFSHLPICAGFYHSLVWQNPAQMGIAMASHLSPI